MSYSATKNPSGAYDIFFNGNKIATGSAAVLPNYGMNESQLFTDQTGAETALGTQATQTAVPNAQLGAGANTSNPIPQNMPDYSGGNTAPTSSQPTNTQSTTTAPTSTQTSQQGTSTQTTTQQPTSSGGQVTTSGGPGVATVVPYSYLNSAQTTQNQTPPPQAPTNVQAGQIGQKYTSYFNSTGGTTAPDSNPRGAIASATSPSQDPIFGALTSSLAPIMHSLTQVIRDINNPAITGQNIQSEYNDLSAKFNLPALQADMLNYSNAMNWTEDDIRDELTKAGGGGTESQVLALAAARNKTLLKQYNAVATQYQAAQTTVSNMMQYATTDQQTALQKEQMSASVVESMASIESQMMQMGLTMQQHATDNLNKIVTNVGYQGLAAQAQGSPQMLSYYENLLGLASGSLSNPQSLAKLETLRQQTVAQGAQRVQIQMYNAGLSTGGSPSAPPGNYITSPSGTQSLVATNAQGSDNQGRPYNLSSNQAQTLLSNGATKDPGTNNIVVPGIGYYIGQGDGSYRLSIDPKSTEGQYIQYKNRVDNPTPLSIPGGPTQQRMARNAYTRQVNSALKQYVESPTYKNVSGGVTYLARINAALTNPGSVSDLELADSIVKLNNAGGQVTDAQLQTYLMGQSWGDKFSVLNGKINAKGGFLSPQQRADMKQQANETFSNYRSQYEELYSAAMKNLDAQRIPDAFWGNMPDFTSFLGGTSYTPSVDL